MWTGADADGGDVPDLELSVGDTAYRWQEHHFDLPSGPGWAHDGVAVLHDGSIVASLTDRAGLATFDGRGALRQVVDTDLTVMHGMTVVEDDGRERLWIADPGSRSVPDTPRYGSLVRPGRAVEVGIDGTVVNEVFQPEHPAYENAGWKPCAVAVDETRFGGSGRVWVADGYGQSLVHCFDTAGRCVLTLDGTESGLAFNTPHGICVDRRGEPELYVADRTNKRLVIYDLDGRFLRTAGLGHLTSPSALTLSGDRLVVAELHGSVAVLGPDDEYVGVLGANDVHDSPGWPNGLDEQGNVTRSGILEPGKFNSPHGIAADPEGNLYVNEWLIGGRLIRLARI